MWTDIKSSEIKEDGHIVMVVEVSAKTIEREIDLCRDYLGRQGGIGPAADHDALIARYGQDELNRLIAQWVMEEHSHPALESLSGPVACDPAFQLLDAYAYGQDLRYELQTYLLPQGELVSVDPIEITSADLAVSKDEIDQHMHEMALAHAQRVPVEETRPVQMGDVARIDSRVSRDGALIAAYSRDGIYLKMETGSMPEQFLDEVLGMLPGEIREFSFEAPLHSGGGTAQFDARVCLLELFEMRLPDVTDEWVRQMFPAVSSVEDLRETIADAIKRQNPDKWGIDAAVDNALASRLDADLPQGMVDFATERMVDTFCAQLAAQGMTLEQHLSKRGITRKDFDTSMRAQANNLLKQAIALDALFEQRGFTLEESELNDAFAAISNQDPIEMKRDYILAGKMHLVEEAARRSKVHQWLVETAIVTD